MNLSYILGGLNAFWDALTALLVQVIAGHINLSIKRRCSSRILRFELLIFMDAFLRVIFAFVFVVPGSTATGVAPVLAWVHAVVSFTLGGGLGMPIFRPRHRSPG
jgi:hypothetical protein